MGPTVARRTSRVQVRDPSRAVNVEDLDAASTSTSSSASGAAPPRLRRPRRLARRRNGPGPPDEPGQPRHRRHWPSRSTTSTPSPPISPGVEVPAGGSGYQPGPAGTDEPTARHLTSVPSAPASERRSGPQIGLPEQLGAIGHSTPASAPRPWVTPVGAGDVAHQTRGHDLVVELPGVASLVHPFDQRRPQRLRQPAADAGDQPHRDLGAVGDRGRGPRPGDAERPVRRRWRPLRSTPGRSRRPRRRARRPAPSRPRRRPAGADGRSESLAVGVDGEHVRVAPAHECLAGEVGPAEHGDGRLVGQRGDEHIGGRVLLDLVGGGAAPPRTGRAR